MSGGGGAGRYRVTLQGGGAGTADGTGSPGFVRIEPADENPLTMDREFKDQLLDRLAEIQRAVTGLTAELHGIMRLVEPCYGLRSGEPCVLGWHRGPHRTATGVEWMDSE